MQCGVGGPFSTATVLPVLCRRGDSRLRRPAVVALAAVVCGVTADLTAELAALKAVYYAAGSPHFLQPWAGSNACVACAGSTNFCGITCDSNNTAIM